VSTTRATPIDWLTGLIRPAEPTRSPARDRAYEIAKRGFDLVAASVLLVLSLPILLVAVAAIKLTSPGPIFFRQLRAGRGGRPFRMYKLRTMVASADDDKDLFRHFNELPTGPCFKMKNDPRVTCVGRWLRRASIDELPQLVNVLAGDMSFVGPRPLPLDEVRRDTPDQLLRLSVKPGLTCLWQISGRTEIPYEEWLALDVWYVRNRTFVLDLQITLKTIPAILSAHGAY
jgi:lipopolysaccharide/colanic/teichoic acid biosynthesis glycosyltransferase